MRSIGRCGNWEPSRRSPATMRPSGMSATGHDSGASQAAINSDRRSSMPAALARLASSGAMCRSQALGCSQPCQLPSAPATFSQQPWDGG
ncbi:Uncharacterised protein [Chromobacterium violaceum]|uniref:Uncharacterized protein n=1 Tax=Chromobacterium violaceum TaxID=536 RepID=A0A447TEE3_CHRVL|nr:Uncharacterised protein [Chromobacterium violaceum]